jgi:hypothetical protein
MANETGERRRRRGGGSGIVWPLILIAAGLLFLLDNLGMVNVDWWELWRLWPLLLVLGGLDLLLGGRSVIGNLLVAVVGLIVLAGAIYLVAGGSMDDLGQAGNRERVTIEESLDGAGLAQLGVRMASGDLSIAALDDSDLLINGVLEVSRDEPGWQVSRDGSTVRLNLDQTQDEAGPFDLDAGDDWQLLLSPRAGYSIEINMGAGNAELDLTGLDVRDLVVEAGAASTEITFPAAGDYTARVTSGVGGIELVVPRDVAVRLQVDRALTALDIPERYERQGDAYVTEDWEGAEQRLELFVNVAVGLLTIRDG